MGTTAPGLVALACALATAWGCGDDSHVPADAEASGDGAMMLDAASTEDGGSSDGDGDGDGIPGSLDCDDTDESVGREATRSCTSDCDIGVQSCTDGTWSECDASTDCACDTPGMMRTIDCGRCGIASQRCGEDGTWETPSECFDEKECFAGEIERDMSMCGSRSRICDDRCEWRPWEVTTPPGECEPGGMGTTSEGCGDGEMRVTTCSDACEFEPTGDCMAYCSRAPMSSRSGADPVCIPEGSFILGSELVGETPVRTITLSEFYIDRFPVTSARVQDCIDAGACETPADSATFDSLADDDWAAGQTVEQMIEFCDWDGGYLVSEYQWEKAGRGGAPDMRPHSWGSALGGCDEHPWMGCEDIPFAVSSFPSAVSPFGVRLMGSLREATSTWYATDHSGVPDRSVDPTGPASGDYRVGRGGEWFDGFNYIEHQASVANRLPVGGTDRGFRCGY